MPPRKSDPAARQSNTISAHFTLKDDVEPASSVPASSSATPRPAPTPVSAIPATPVAAPAVEMETDRPSDSVPPPDKERKESRDAVTIEVHTYCLMISMLCVWGVFCSDSLGTDQLSMHPLGPHSSQVDNNAPREGRLATEHSDTDECRSGNEQECHRVHKPSGQCVRTKSMGT